MVAGGGCARAAPLAGGVQRPEGSNFKQEMDTQFFSPLFGGITNTPPSVQSPPLHSLRYTDEGSTFASVQDCTERRMQVNLSYSGSGPDMFGLVTSILQEPREQESLTDWSCLVPPVSASDAENESSCSRLFPTRILENMNLTDRAQSPYEENREKPFSVELLKSKLNDLHLIPAWFAPPNPCCPSSDAVLKNAIPEGAALESQGFHQHLSGAKRQGDTGSRKPSSLQPRIQNRAPLYEECQETKMRGVLGVNEVEGPNSYFAQLEKIQDLAIWENNLCSETCLGLAGAHKSQHFTASSPYFLIIPVGAGTELQESSPQSSQNGVDVAFGNTECKISVYPPKVYSNNFPLNLGLQNRKSSGYKCLDSKTLNIAPASYIAHQKQKRVNTLPKEYSTNPLLGQQPFSSQRKDGILQMNSSVSNSLSFSNTVKNGRHPNHVGPSHSNLLAPTQKDREVSARISYGRFSHHSTNQSAKCHQIQNKQNSAGEGTGQDERQWRHYWMPCQVSLGPGCANHDGLRRKQEQNAFPLPDVVDLRCDNFLHLSPIINDLFWGDVAASCLAFPPQLNCHRPPRHRHGGPAHELRVYLEECCQQGRALEKERKKTEADLARMFPGHQVSSSSNIPFSRLPIKPSRVDRLILDQFQEQAKVCALLGEMERLGGLSLHANIAVTLEGHLEAICATQARRKDERIIAVNPQGLRATRSHREKDILALAAAVKDLAFFTRKTRTALWCAFQMTLSKTLASLVRKEEVQRALQELCPASDTRQAKVFIESKDKKNPGELIRNYPSRPLNEHPCNGFQR